MAACEARRDGVVLDVRVQPRAGRDGILGVQGDRLRLRVAAPPVDGEATAACRSLLAEAFGVPLSAVRLLKGERSRDKTFAISGDPAALESAFAAVEKPV
ncbi:MAG: YggU family protein [Candidatus Sericytochromatia bacterium]|nr:YggU family protein [Candidatus Tanganyikabacteria bacterium]